jgi:hypothetical protein
MVFRPASNLCRNTIPAYIKPFKHFKHMRTVLFFLLLSLLACQNQSNTSYEKQAPPPPVATESAPAQYTADGTGTAVFSSAAARPSAIDSLKKFIRTADMRFQVKNAARATIQAEDIVLRHGGFVIQSNLNSNIESQKNIPVSQDSARQITRFSTHCQLTLRVPYIQLDTTLRAIGQLADFLQSRQVQAEDVSLQLLEKELLRLRESRYQSELAETPENKNAPKPERARDSRAANDQARIETLKIEDQIRYSTIHIELYEQPRVLQTMVANTDVAMPQPPLGLRLREALAGGAELLLSILIGIVHLWSVWLLLGIGYLVWKRGRKEVKSV